MNQVIPMPMRETLEKLTSTAAILNKESDELNAVIDDFEEQLEAAGVGISVWLNEDYYLLDQSHWTDKSTLFDDGDEETEGYALGYAKVDGKWRVAVKSVTLRRKPGSDETTCIATSKATPLAKASRAVRVEAAEHLEKLADLLTHKMGEYIDSIEKAKGLIRE